MHNYHSFFETIQSFTQERNEQIAKGISDYNMVNVVRKENAEVGMHSNIIYSLLDPNGLHYRGDLFAKLFIKHVLKIEDFGEDINVNAEESTAENKRIDFTLKGNRYYVGIEMKIDAEDSQHQIYDYEYDLQNKAKQDNIDNVRIYYLTKDGRDPNSKSIYNKSGDKYAQVTNISFENDILNWLDLCQEEVRGLSVPDLYLALKNYIQIVKKITGQYKGSLMSLEDYLSKIEHANIPDYFAIFDEIDALQERVQKDFIQELFIDLNSFDNIEKVSSSMIDIYMNDYIVRLYLDVNRGNFLIQIGDSSKFTQRVNDAQRIALFEKFEKHADIQKKIKNRSWEKGYCEFELDKVRFQTKNKIIDDTKKILATLTKSLLNTITV